MEKRFFDAGISGIIPVGLPGGFFIYEANGHESVLYAGPNVLALYGCENMGEFIELTGGTFQGMVHPDDYNRIQNQIQAQTIFGEKKHDYVRYRIMTRQGTERYVEDFGHLLHRGDGKSYYYVYLACNSIKNRHDINYCIYDELLRENLRKQQYVIDHIDEAIENEYIKVYYQPVIRVKTGEICGYEALVRWVDPKMGFLSPGDFISTLEQYHLIHLLETFMVKKVCEDYNQLKNEGKELVPVSINISRLDFELCDIFGIVEETRAKYDVPRKMLDLEITESALDQNGGYIKQECDRMRELGYSIWIDDFGSGYSSLNTVAEYNSDVLKLDMVFMRNFSNNSKTAKLLSFIMKGARAMDVAPLCEGVETKEQYEYLKGICCERVQGYFFGKPMPMEETRAITMAKGMKWETPEYRDIR